MPKLSKKVLVTRGAAIVAAATTAAFNVRRHERPNRSQLEPSTEALFSLSAEAQSFNFSMGFKSLSYRSLTPTRPSHDLVLGRCH